MTDYDNTNRGAIWKNEERTDPNHPHFKGSENVVCPHCNKATDYLVSAWKRKEGASDRSPALSFSVKPKQPKAGTVTPQVPIGEAMDDEIPF